MRGSDEVFFPRILYTEPLIAAPAEMVGGAATLGFSHIMVPRPNAASIETMLEACSDAGLALLLDVVVDRMDLGSDLADPTGLFMLPDPDALLDPRRNVDAAACIARLTTEAEANALGSWWAGHLATWHRAGVAGIRLLGLSACPPFLLPALLRPLRQVGAHDASSQRRLETGSQPSRDAPLLFVSTPGMSRAQIGALRGTGLDGVFGSLPWWNFRADWFWDELALLREIAPVIGAADTPSGPSAPPAAHAIAAVLGHGWMATAPADMAQTRALNALLASGALHGVAGSPTALNGPGSPVVALLRVDAMDLRQAACGALIVVNTDANRAAPADPSMFLPATGGKLGTFTAVFPADGAPLSPTLLNPGEMRVYVAHADAPQAVVPALSRAEATAAAASPRLGIENISPAVDVGAYPVKRTAGELVMVQADILFDGHDKIAAALRWRAPGATDWLETPMRELANDRWQGAFPLQRLGRHTYAVIAWRDRFASFRDEVAKKHAAGVEIGLETIEGEALVKQAAARSTGTLRAKLSDIAARIAAGDADCRRDALLSDALNTLMIEADDRPFSVESAPISVDAERIGARFASWYEVFPRSLSDDAGRHGRFADVIRHLPRIRAMGFDVLYFPPIHPIGRTNRKGPNNTLTPGPTDPGSPYAIGSVEGGHDALHPELGTFEDFQALRREAAAHGMEIAIDFAIQCAPDHPWLKTHPGWFDWRPDGTVKYAENPPKKYQDIVNVDFYAEDAVPDLWLELCRIVLFWAEHGVRLFRVDNPHTKPFPFWEWMIGEVRARYPDAVFLAEAFTRPKIMYRLAKIGFSQSYTYFTWRNTKRELQAYFSELADDAPRDFFRPHLFVNTPDINPVFLQNSGRPGHLIRAALATTLSGLWGVYNGFELCEATPLPGREEYLDSEKYQLRQWDWDRPDNIVPEITALNRARRHNPALQSHLGITFLTAFNDAILYYEKATPDRGNVVLVAVSLDPTQPQECDFEVPLWSWKLPDNATVAVDDLISGNTWTWNGKTQHLRLTPESPYMICRVRPL